MGEVRSYQINSPFTAGETSYGPPASSWSTAHLNWLKVMCSEDHPLIRDTHAASAVTHLFHESVWPQASSSLAKYLKDELGLAWDEIVESSPGSRHYDRLLSLDKLRDAHELNFAPPTSGPPTSQRQPPSPSTPLRTSGFRSSPPLHDDSTTQGENSPRFETPSRASQTIGNVVVSSVVALENFTAVAPEVSTPSEGPQSPGSRPKGMTPISQQSFCPDASTPTVPLTQTYDKPESDVVAAGTAVLVVLQLGMRRLSHDPKLQCGIRQPSGLTIQVDALLCTCEPDLYLVAAAESGDEESRYKIGEVYGEFKRLDHGKKSDDILGQEVATLLGLATKYQPPASTSNSRGAPKRPKVEPKIMTTYMYSWHHLRGYITRLDVPLDVLHDIQSELPPNLARAPLQVKQSRKFDLKDADDRVLFITAIGAIVMHRLSKYDKYRKLVRELCEA